MGFMKTSCFLLQILQFQELQLRCQSWVIEDVALVLSSWLVSILLDWSLCLALSPLRPFHILSIAKHEDEFHMPRRLLSF